MNYLTNGFGILFFSCSTDRADAGSTWSASRICSLDGLQKATTSDISISIVQTLKNRHFDAFIQVYFIKRSESVLLEETTILPYGH